MSTLANPRLTIPRAEHPSGAPTWRSISWLLGCKESRFSDRNTGSVAPMRSSTAVSTSSSGGPRLMSRQQRLTWRSCTGDPPKRGRKQHNDGSRGHELED
jgi:hypothetical protein